MYCTDILSINFPPPPPAQVDETSEAESFYDRLLARVGAAISIHPQLVKIVSYIVLFSSDFTSVNSRQRSRVETIQVGRKIYQIYS